MNEINNKLASKNFWVSYFKDIDSFSKSLLKSSNEINTFSEDKKITIDINNKIYDDIKKTISNSDYLLYVYFNAVFQFTALKYTNKEKMLTGMYPLSNTNDEHIFNKILPLIVDISDVQSFKNLLNISKEQLKNVYKNQNVSLKTIFSDQLISKVENEYMYFILRLNNIHEMLPLKNMIDIHIYEQVENSRFSIEINYNSNLFNDLFVEEFADSFFEILKQVSENINIDLNDIKISNCIDTTKKDDQDLLKRILEHSSVCDAKVIVQDKKNIAYIVGEPNKFRSTHLLMKFLSSHLDEEMLPEEIHWVDILPEDKNLEVTHNVEITSNKLRLHEPLTENEKKVKKVWAEVLNINADEINLKDDFYELGGDSILSMQVFFKLKEKGFGLNPQDMIATPYIKDIASKFNEVNVVDLNPTNLSKIVHLTPSQEWFFEKKYLNKNFINNFVAVSLQDKYLLKHVDLTIEALAKNHSALTASFIKDKDTWKQSFDSVDTKKIFDYHSISVKSDHTNSSEILSIFNDAHKEISLTEGPLYKFVYISINDTQDILGIVAHRTMSDGISLDILLEDFCKCIKASKQGQEILLPKETTSLATWSNLIEMYKHTDEFKKGSMYWENVSLKNINHSMLPDQKEKFKVSLEKNTVILYKKISHETTKKIENFVSQSYKTGIREVLFASFLKVMKEWASFQNILIETGGHGRELINDNLDLSRTVGWFTTNYPILLSMPETYEDFSSIVKSIKNQTKNIPKNGFDYGILRYQTDQKNQTFKLNPLIGIDYQGKINSNSDENSLFQVIESQNVNERDLNNQRVYVFDISSWIEDGEFVLRWSYDKTQFEQNIINKLMKELLNNLEDLASSSNELSLSLN